jgi:hypothetical protein
MTDFILLHRRRAISHARDGGGSLFGLLISGTRGGFRIGPADAPEVILAKITKTSEEKVIRLPHCFVR